MTKFFCLTLSLICLFCGVLQANDTLVELKGAYFLPESSKFKKIYSEGGIYGAELSYQTWRGIYLWGSIDYFTKSGKSLDCHYHTRISMLPLGLGLKCFFRTPHQMINFYVGGGLLGTCIHIHDKSPFVTNKISKFKCSGIAKVGALVNFEEFFIDTYVNYFNSPSKYPVGGWTFGIGIGRHFDIFGCY